MIAEFVTVGIPILVRVFNIIFLIMNTKFLSHHLLSLVLMVALAVPLVACAFGNSSILSTDYRLSGDPIGSNSSIEDDTIVIGQKDSGKYIESYSLEWNAPDGKDISIAYRSHIQDYGWVQWSPSGQEVAYEQYFGVDTIQIMLYGKDAFMYDVSYRIAIVGEDWQEWVSDGAVAGIPDEHRPIEAIEIRLELNEEYEPATWTITEFGDDSGNQAMFYTMRNNNDGTLIVVDGGWNENEAQVRSVITLFGGHVDHWFLTHYDEDHASVFNAIYADPQGIEIGEVYCTPLDYEYYLECAADRWWDVPWVYETFLNQTEGDERINYLNRGDYFEIDGLQFEVFNSYDQIVVDTGTRDVANYASLMFKITGEEDTFLFCGDVYNGMGMQLLEMYGDELDAEYVQPGHHGNHSMPAEFYEAIGPEVMFFDGPAWLTESDDYTAKALIEWCHENGIVTYEYATAPNSIPFN